MNKLVFTPELLEKYQCFINEKMGLFYSQDQWTDLQRRLKNIVLEFKFKDPYLCLKWLQKKPLSREQLQILARFLTIGETYFFRDRPLFNLLEKKILPEIISQKKKTKEINLWCCACSTGEEVYSLSILFHKLIFDLKEWKIKILGTDIYGDVLKKAEEGHYREWSFRAIDPELKSRFFNKLPDGTFRIIDTVKSLTSFRYLNLVEDPFPNSVDFILCANVLIYFSDDKITKVISKLEHSLIEHGYLFTSSIESPFIKSSHLKLVKQGSILFFKKNEELTEKRVVHNLMHQPSVKQSKVTESFEDQLKKAFSLFKIGLYEKSEKILLKLNLIQKNNQAIIETLIQIYSNLRNYDEALKWCEKKIDYEPFNPQIHYLKANLLDEKGSRKQALKAIKQAIFLDNNFIMGYYLMGLLLLKEKAFDESRKSFDNAIGLIKKIPKESVIPGSEEINAGKLEEMIHIIVKKNFK